MTRDEIPISQYLIDSATADIAINDLGLTLDEPEFSWELCPWAEYNKSYCGDDTQSIYFKRYETLGYMIYYLCLLKGGFEFAKQLAKTGGLLNRKIDCIQNDGFNSKLFYTQIVTESSLEHDIKSTLEEYMTLKHVDAELQLATHYKQLFKEYCLKFMDECRLKWKIIDKIETYLKHI